MELAELEAQWDAALDPDEDGICNVCGHPAEAHPLPEHRAAVLAPPPLKLDM